MSSVALYVPITPWGGWLYGLAQCSDAQLASRDIAEINLACAEDLAGTENDLLAACLQKVDDWTTLVEQGTRRLRPIFEIHPERCGHSEARFRIMAMAQCLQQGIGVHYNFAFATGEYDASDSRNLFIHGILSGFGGTCTSLPVLYCAIGRRLGYPLSVAETGDHNFCRWDDESGEQLCFDATSPGCAVHEEDYYRKWPRPLSPAQERKNGFIRGLTRREELASAAANRGNCLMDNFQCDAAVEAFYLARMIAPHRHCLKVAWGLAIYTSKLYFQIQAAPIGWRDSPIEPALRAAAQHLEGPDVGFFRAHAIENILRILRNRRRRRQAAVHQDYFQTLGSP